jgi:glycogen synthase
MNIAFVNPEYPSLSGNDQGGIATYTYSMALACAHRGHRVHILVKKGTVPKPLHEFVTFHIYGPVPLTGPFHGLHRKLNGEIYWERAYALGVRQLLFEIHRHVPLDIVEVPEYNGLAFELNAPVPFPVVVHFHTPTFLVDLYNAAKISRRRKQWYLFEKKACFNASAYRCPSLALTKEICIQYAIAEKSIAIIRHPFDTTVFDAIQKSRSGNQIDILFVGRLERRKGAEIIQKNIQRILSLDPRLRFTFVGEYAIGDIDLYRCAIERSLSEIDRKRVWFLGPTKREILPVLYCRSNLIFFPSLFENAPYTLLEAMAAKLPIVAANTGGITELLQHGENGLLFDPDASDDLVECIQTIIQHPRQAESLANNAYTKLVNDYKPEKVAHVVEAFYNSVISSFRKK